MRIVRFLLKDRECWGSLQADSVRPFTAPRERVPFSRIRLLPPSVPTKIVCAGLNYRSHAAEMRMPVPREPVIFIKPPSSLIAHGRPIVYPAGVRRLDFEAELALVIGRTAKDVSERAAARHILGYTCLNDVTARDLQKKDVQWTRAKSFDTFCPVGPWIETDFSFPGKRIRAFLNGRLRQDADMSDFIFSPCSLVSFISSVMTLYPGDIVSTGTPSGIAAMRPGDRVVIDIEGIGRLENSVVAR